MDKQRASYIITDTVKQRNILLVFCGVLLLVTLIQMVMLLSQEKQVILLPTIRDEIIVSNKQVSSSYLRLVSKEIYSNVLTYTPALQQADLHRVLQYVSPSSYYTLHQKLNERFQDYNNRNISTHFSAIREEANGLSVNIEGYLTTYLGGSEIITEHKKYLLEFEYTGTQLLLVDFIELGEQQ